MLTDEHLNETKIDLGEGQGEPDPNVPMAKGQTPSVEDRDPRGVNAHLKVSFEDVIAEPDSVHSFDKIWIWSDALFEVSKLWCYRIISLIFAVPVSLISGILFAILSCLHIWCVMPCIKNFLMNMPSIQTIWGSIVDVVISPCCESMGRCFSSINLHIARD
uniref:caveolin-2-like n=1 Tax=Pristiophorus japonicus TaxID=55135 RepID=UPI00398F6C60